MKGIAEAVLSNGGPKKKKPEEDDEPEMDSLEMAVEELFESKDPKTRAAAFKAAVSMCGDYGDDE
jgi:hypothetical protein